LRDICLFAIFCSGLFQDVTVAAAAHGSAVDFQGIRELFAAASYLLQKEDEMF